MKLRIRGNFIRLRLTRSEVDRFAADGRVEESVDFGPDKPKFNYVLESVPAADGAFAEFANNTVFVFVPEDEARMWVRSEQVGIESSEVSGLRVLIEKDFACLQARPGENEADAFPNPDPAACIAA
jgi:hypothetical protein